MMEYLNPMVESGNLKLQCPLCGGSAWEPSLIYRDHLACKNHECSTHLPVMFWVTFIKRKGDDDPGIFLAIWREVTEGGFYVQVDTSARKSEHAESVRFCTPAGCGRSFTVLNCLTSIAHMFKKGERTAAKFSGVGGELTIYRGSGDDDMWVKTADIENDSFYGAKVFFAATSEIGPYFQEIMAAMIASSKARPIE